MPQSLAKIYLHIIFSTKNRENSIDKKIRPQLYSYIATVLQSISSSLIIIGGMPDHIHISCLLSKTHTISKILEEIKKRSSKWIKTKGIEYKTFSWQSGYGIFSVSQSQIDVVKKYIENQEQHHK